MTKDFKQIADDVMNGVGLIRQGAPDATKAFGALSSATTATHALDTKTKELMALAIGIAGKSRRDRGACALHGRKYKYTQHKPPYRWLAADSLA